MGGVAHAVGNGRVRAVGTVQEEITGVVTLAETPAGGTLVSWAVEFRPVVPGTGWAISLVTKRVAKRSMNEERSKDVDTS